MNHICLDGQDDAVKQFFLSLPVAPQGSVLELDGHAVACILPVSAEGDTGAAAEWTEAKNARRCVLIDREIAGALTPGGGYGTAPATEGDGASPPLGRTRFALLLLNREVLVRRHGLVGRLGN